MTRKVVPDLVLPLVIAVLLAAPMPSRANPSVIDKRTMAQVDQCVEAAYNQFITLSQSMCRGEIKYYDSGGNMSSTTQKNSYNIGPDFPGYRFRSGTQSATQIGGACEHEINAIFQTDSVFTCRYYTKGCGPTKGGGHVRGYCSIGIEYIPRAGDVAKIKKYCLSKFSGGPVLPQPVAYPKSCVLP